MRYRRPSLHWPHACRVSPKGVESKRGQEAEGEAHCIGLSIGLYIEKAEEDRVEDGNEPVRDLHVAVRHK